MVVVNTLEGTDYGVYTSMANTNGSRPTNKRSWFSGDSPVLGDGYRVTGNNAISLYYWGSAFEVRNR